MGWTEGTGLGKNRDGMKEHVKIKPRQDEMGLGREKEMAKEMGNVWWKDSVGGTLARLQQKKKSDKEKKKRKKDKKTSKSKSGESIKTTIKTYTDEELFAATGGARFGMRAQRRAEGKWKRTESGNELSELEKKAKKSMEWNGRGSAQVVMEENTTNKKRKLAEKNISTVLPPMPDEKCDVTDEDEKRSKKKRRKLEKESKKLHQVSLSASEEEEAAPVDKESSKEKKRKKKEKKSKKSSKKENQ